MNNFIRDRLKILERAIYNEFKKKLIKSNLQENNVFQNLSLEKQNFNKKKEHFIISSQINVNPLLPPISSLSSHENQVTN